MGERRKYERIEVPLEINVTWPGNGLRLAITMNFSDGGALLRVSFDKIPPRGTEMQLQLNATVLGKPAPILRARVQRATATLIAFQFIPDKQEA